MGTPLKLKDASGNFQEVTTAEENYIAYQIGMHLSLSDSAQEGSLSRLGDTTIGTFSNTFFNEPVGTHPGTSITTGTTNYPVYQRTGTAAETDSDWSRPLEWVDSGGATGFKEMTDASLNEAVDRYLSTIFTNDYPGTYKVGSSSPGVGYSLANSNVFTDTRTDGTSTQFNLYKKTSYSAPSAITPVKIESSSPIAISGMTERQIRQTFGQRAKTRINASKIGTYQIRSNAQGAPTDPGTWVSKGAVTDTKQQTADQVYTRDFTQQFQRAYTRNYVTLYQNPFTRIRQDTTFETNYTRNYANLYTRTFTRVAAETFDTNYIGTYQTLYVGTYERTYTGTYATDYQKSYTNTYVSQYENENVNYNRPYQNNYTTDYIGTYQRLYSSQYITSYDTNYQQGYTGALNYDTDYNRTGTFSATYVRAYDIAYLQGPYNRGYARTYNIAYVPNYTTSYAQGPYDRAFVANYTGNYIRDTTPNYQRNFNTAYQGNYTSGPYTRAFQGFFSSTYTRDVGFSPGAYAGSFEVNYLNPEYLSMSSFATNAFQAGYLRIVLGEGGTQEYEGIRSSIVQSDNFFDSLTYDGYAGGGTTYIGGPNNIPISHPSTYIPTGGTYSVAYLRDENAYNDYYVELNTGVQTDYVKTLTFLSYYQAGLDTAGVAQLTSVFNNALWQSAYYALGSSVDNALSAYVQAAGAQGEGLTGVTFGAYFIPQYTGPLNYVRVGANYVGPGVFSQSYLGPGSPANYNSTANYIGTLANNQTYTGPGTGYARATTATYVGPTSFYDRAVNYDAGYVGPNLVYNRSTNVTYTGSAFYQRAVSTSFFVAPATYQGGVNQFFTGPPVNYVGDRVYFPDGTSNPAVAGPGGPNVIIYSQVNQGQRYARAGAYTPTGINNVRVYNRQVFYSGRGANLNYTLTLESYYTGGEERQGFATSSPPALGAAVTFNVAQYVVTYQGPSLLYTRTGSSGAQYLGAMGSGYTEGYFALFYVGPNNVLYGPGTLANRYGQSDGTYGGPMYSGPAPVYTREVPVSYVGTVAYSRDNLATYLGPAASLLYTRNFSIDYIRNITYARSYNSSFLNTNYVGPATATYTGAAYLGPSTPTYVGPANYQGLGPNLLYNRLYTGPNQTYVQENAVSFYISTGVFETTVAGATAYLRLYDMGTVYTTEILVNPYAQRFGGPSYQRFYERNFQIYYTRAIAYVEPYQRAYTNTFGNTNYIQANYTNTYVGDYVGFLQVNYVQAAYQNSYTRADPNQLSTFNATYTGPNYTKGYAKGYQTAYTQVNYTTVYETGYINQYDTNTNYQRRYTNDPVYVTDYIRNFDRNYDNEFSANYDGAAFQASYAKVYTNTYNPEYINEFLQYYVKDYAQDYERPYIGTFETNYTGTYEETYAGTYEGLYTSVYTGAFVAQYQTTYVGTYTANYTSVYEGTYTQDYLKDYITDYTGNFIGNFSGETIQPSSGTNETYTLYVRIA